MSDSGLRTTPPGSLLSDPRDWGHDDYNAVFFGTFARVPTYHGFDYRRNGRSDDEGVSRDYTRCGMVVSEYDRETGRLKEPGQWLPLRHAVKFGRPCKKCFPGGPA